MKVAIVHEWFDSYAGSERVVEQLLQIYPQADVHCLVDFLPDSERGFLRGHRVHTSFLQRLPRAREKFRAYLPLMPLAVSQFDLSRYDLVISSSHAVAKGARTRKGQVHVSYVHAPMRYAWDQEDLYLARAGLDRGVKRVAAKTLMKGLRVWDRRATAGVDALVANSESVRHRIQSCYGRDATVIHPPVAVDRLPLGAERRDCYLVAARLVPYKRVDLVVEAFRRMPSRRLIVVGDGPERERIARGSAANIELLGYQDRHAFIRLLSNARAFVYAGEEDFGITLAEAQACGTPVIALGRGGALDIVSPHTGVLFAEQSAEAVVAAVQEFETTGIIGSPGEIRASAMRFSEGRFRNEFSAAVAAAHTAKASEPQPATRIAAS